jgi:hypothetical protein
VCWMRMGAPCSAGIRRTTRRTCAAYRACSTRNGPARATASG